MTVVADWAEYKTEDGDIYAVGIVYNSEEIATPLTSWEDEDKEGQRDSNESRLSSSPLRNPAGAASPDCPSSA